MVAVAFPKNTVVVVVMAVAMLVVAARPGESLTCGQVYGAMAPCINYIRAGGYPPPNCCSGIKGLVASARTTADRQAACGCLKTVTNGFAGLSLIRSVAVPGLCGVPIPYKISPSTDCTRVR